MVASTLTIDHFETYFQVRSLPICPVSNQPRQFVIQSLMLRLKMSEFWNGNRQFHPLDTPIQSFWDKTIPRPSRTKERKTQVGASWLR
jgi:hypothetical protein